METKYCLEVEETIIIENLKRILNQIYKLLPFREEGLDWEKPLETIIIELSGMDRLLSIPKMFPLICKLEGLFILIGENDFLAFRRTIFECITLIEEVKNYVESGYVE